MVLHADGPRVVPPPRRVRSGHIPAQLAITEPEPPASLAIRGWTRIEQGDRWQGGRSFEYSLAPIEDDGETVGWLAEMDLRVRKRMYLFVRASWEGTDGCGGGEGVWSFYLKTKHAVPYKSGIVVLKRQRP